MEITQESMLKPMCTNIVNLWALSRLYSSLAYDSIFSALLNGFKRPKPIITTIRAR